jgi:ABC-2 type transport system permease protein
MRIIKALFIKECLQIIRDPSSLLISFFLPLLLLFLYGYGVSLDLNHLKIGLVLEDTAPDAQSFAKSLTDSPYFDVKIARDQRSLTEDLIRGSIRGIVVIPPYFSQFRHRQDAIAPIQVISDGSETNTSNFVQNYVQGAFMNWLQQEHITSNLGGLPLIQVQSRYWYNEQLESRFFLLSGSLAIIMTLIGSLLTALVVAREWERGTMESLMSTTVTIWQLLIGKILPYFFLGMLSMGVCVLISTTIFGLPFRGSPLLLAVVSMAFLFCSLGFGLMVSTLSKNQVLAYQIALVAAFLPAYILSGFLFEISSMPFPIRLLTYIIGAKYFVQCLQTLFLVGNIYPLIFFNLIPILALGALFFLITSCHTKKRLD